MIIKCVNARDRLPINMNYVYPIISYKYNSKSDRIDEFLIIDDCGSLYWYSSEYFVVESLANEKYVVEEEKQDLRIYSYDDLENIDFFSKYHMEDDDAVEIKNRIQRIEIDIFKNECDYEKIKYYLSAVDSKDFIYDILFHALVDKISKLNIQDFIENVTDNVTIFSNDLLDIIIDKMTEYHNDIVFEFIIKIYSECEIVGKSLEKVEDYIENY